MNVHGCVSSINYLLSYMEINFQDNNNLVNKGHSQNALHTSSKIYSLSYMKINLMMHSHLMIIQC
jgi:hypothetical protein